MSVIYLTLWEVIGIVSGVFFFMLFLITLASYLYQVYSNDTHFNALDASENGNSSEENSMNQKSFVQYYCDKILDNVNDITTSSKSTSKSNKNKPPKKKKAKIKIKVPLSAIDDAVSDEETGVMVSTEQHNNKNPSKTQHLYASSSSKVTGTSKVTGYKATPTGDDTPTVTTTATATTTRGPSTSKRVNLSTHTSTSKRVNLSSRASSTSSPSLQNDNTNNHNTVKNIDSSTAPNKEGSVDLSTSFSGREARHHPSQVI